MPHDVAALHNGCDRFVLGERAEPGQRVLLEDEDVGTEARTQVAAFSGNAAGLEEAYLRAGIRQVD